MDPVSTLAAGVNSSIRILEVTYQLKTVDEQTSDLLKTTEHVNRNIGEARRLRRMKIDHIDDAECSWMDRIINDTEHALLEVARLIEPARVDVEVGMGVNSKNRILWVLRDGPKVKDKHQKLAICHQSLTAVITALHSKDMGWSSAAIKEKEQQPPPYDAEMEALFKWKRRRRGKSRANISAMVSHPDCAELPPQSPMSVSSDYTLRTLDSRGSPQLELAPFTTFDPWDITNRATIDGAPLDNPSVSALDLTLDRPQSTPASLPSAPKTVLDDQKLRDPYEIHIMR